APDVVSSDGYAAARQDDKRENGEAEKERALRTLRVRRCLRLLQSHRIRVERPVRDGVPLAVRPAGPDGSRKENSGGRGPQALAEAVSRRPPPRLPRGPPGPRASGAPPSRSAPPRGCPARACPSPAARSPAGSPGPPRAAGR